MQSEGYVIDNNKFSWRWWIWYLVE